MLKALIWKLLERFGVQGIQFIMQIILARLLSPEHYGILSLMIVFTTLANVFIQNGFNAALIQNKDVTEEDYSSVLWVSLSIAVVMYGAIFFAAPLIGQAYKMPDIVPPLRVLALMLLPGALNSVQLAKVSREMDFKKVFTSNIAGVLVSGMVGIMIAYCGGGLWALVAQTLLNTVFACAVMCFTVKWRIRFVCNLERVRILFGYGWKLVVSGLLDTLYRDIHSLIIGLKYDRGTLGFESRGKQFPAFLLNGINGAVQSVMLPALSQKQENRDDAKMLMRSSIVLCSYIIFPIMAGLAGVAKPLVSLLLTDKWLPCVPYLQIYCFSYAFYPVHTSNLQAINAMGRSDVFLKLEVLKKAFALILLLCALYFFDTPIAIAATGIISAFTSGFINALPNKKLIGYSYSEQMKDIAPSFAIALIMCVCVLLLNLLQLPAIVLLLLQCGAGIIVYILLSMVFRVPAFYILLNQIKRVLKKRELIA